MVNKSTNQSGLVAELNHTQVKVNITHSTTASK